MRWLEGRGKMLALVGVVGWMGCITIADLEISQSASTTIPGTPEEAGDQLDEEDFAFDEFQDFTFDFADVTDVSLKNNDIKNLRLTQFDMITTTDGADLSFMDTVQIFFQSESLGEEPVLIAEATDFPVGEPFVDFLVENVDLSPATLDTSITITMVIEGEVPDRDIDVDATLGFGFGISAKGACRVIQIAQSL